MIKVVHMLPRLSLAPIALCALLESRAAHAVVFTVGADGACSTNSIQAAINATANGDVVRIARNATYSAQALQISNRRLTLEGGYDTCASPSASGATTLSGQGGAQDSVITIRGQSDITLQNLSIIRGDEVFDGYGGGVDYKGHGALRLVNTGVAQNYAGYGGGISAISEGGNVTVEIKSGTVVQLNTAQFSGGGVRIEGDVYLKMIEPDSILLSNAALGINPTNNTPQYGNGGGLQVIAPASADIGSPGLGASGAIAFNTARYGGGIAIDGADTDSLNSSVRVRVFTTVANNSARIHGNRASQSGGGIHLLPFTSGVLDTTYSYPYFCAWNVRIEDNKAQQGAAIYGDTAYGTLFDVSSLVAINEDGTSPCQLPTGMGANDCQADTPCNTIRNNASVTATDVPTSGATVLMQNLGHVDLHKLRLNGNRGGSLLRFFEPDIADLSHLLISGNTLSEPVLRVEDGGNVIRLEDSTIAGNTLSAAPVLSIASDFALRRALIWQPGNAALTLSGALTVDDVLAHEISTLGGGPEATVAPPRFVDPAHGDYSLQVASAGADFATAVPGDDTDLNGAARDVDLPIKMDFRGPRDVGALERQTVGNLVLNGNFPARSDAPPDVLRLWTQGVPALTTWIDTEGAPGSLGAAYVRYTPAATSDAPVGTPIAYLGLSQCVNIPSAGVYRLNGWSRVPGTVSVGLDYARIHWRLRGNGPDCVGVITAEGNHFLARSNSWSLATPAQIDIAPGTWTSNTTIELSLEVLDGDAVGTNAVDAYFDEISLIATGLEVDNIFKNGFE